MAATFLLRAASASCLVLGAILSSCSGDDGASGTPAAGGGAAGTSGGGGASGNAGGGGASGNAGAGGAAGTGGSSGAGGSAGSSGSAGSGGAGALGGPFRHGVNFGYVPGLDDAQMATLGRRAGANSARISLPEQHLDKWGWDIETADMASYLATGLHDNVVFLTAPTAAHSSAPSGTPDWELAYYLPKNLYQPIFLSDSSVNPDNYWAVYVEKTVQVYKTWIKVWSVWNEPDWVSDWQVTQTWDKSPPTAAQLPRFNGSIFDYVRMLRITTEVAKKVDPEARVAVGGLGYPTFLSAVVRYTDNPQDGSVTADYPKTGAQYFDVVDMHYYPIFSPGNSDTGAAGLIGLKKEFQAVLDAAGASGKPFVVTESGAPHLANSGPGGPEYARGYLLKAMTLAQAEGILGVDWFALGDGQDPASGPFAAMGLYSNLHGLPDLNAAKQTEAGVAYATLGKLLDDARYDAAGTAALGLGSDAAGGAFRVSDAPGASRAWVLWAKVTGPIENAAAAAQIPTDKGVDQYEWNWSADATATQSLPSAAGKVAVQLTGTPRIFVEK
ncbi:MAG: hypothetical protein HY898_17390 [Deltaproteobacteria bacterium]|nr:hypothetical protein [Deltaproteobacteria bacterium]